MGVSARLNLPFLSAGQAGKEFVHNEALQTLDLVAAAAVEEGPRSDPPASPVVGACYLVGPSPTGEWAGKDQFLAGFTSGGWRYVAPQEGLTALVKSTGSWACYRSANWEIGQLRGSTVVLDGVQVVGPRLSEIAEPTGGDVIDAEGRAAIGQILAALRGHGLIES